MSADNLRTPADLQARVQAFVFDEADLLDRWCIDDWLGLFTDDGSYQVLPLNVDIDDLHGALYLVNDDHARLVARVAQLQRKTAWAEQPRSRTRRLVSNVRTALRNDVLEAEANFAVWRFKNDQTDLYVGRYLYQFASWTDDPLRIRTRRVALDLESLRPHGKLSFIL